jgi:hypothetical protein
MKECLRGKGGGEYRNGGRRMEVQGGKREGAKRKREKGSMVCSLFGKPGGVGAFDRIGGFSGRLLVRSCHFTCRQSEEDIEGGTPISRGRADPFPSRDRSLPSTSTSSLDMSLNWTQLSTTVQPIPLPSTRPTFALCPPPFCCLTSERTRRTTPPCFSPCCDR